MLWPWFHLVEPLGNHMLEVNRTRELHVKKTRPYAVPGVIGWLTSSAL